MSDTAKRFFDVPPDEERVARMIADSVYAFMKLHETVDHGGLPCWDERCNLIAFLCHRTGIKAEHVAFISERLKEYELRHDEEVATHGGH